MHEFSKKTGVRHDLFQNYNLFKITAYANDSDL